MSNKRNILAVLIVGIAVILAIATLVTITDSQKNKINVEAIKLELSQYMQDIYAPKSMKQFDDAYKKSFNDGCLTVEVAKRLFVKYSDELTASDLQRVCETKITYGEAKDQKDGKARFIVKTYLYERVGTNPIIRDFVFIMEDYGKISDFTIEIPAD